MTPEVRIKNLSNIIKEIGEKEGLNTPYKVAKAYDINPSFVSQLMAGSRSFGEKAARNIEKKLGLPDCSLDRVQNNEGGLFVIGSNTNHGTQIGTQHNLTQSVSDKETLDEVSANHLKDMPLLDIDAGVRFALNPNCLPTLVYDQAERAATFIPHTGRTFGIKINADITGVAPSTIRKSDILIIEPSIVPRDNDLVLVCLDYQGSNRGVVARLFVSLAGNRTIKYNDNPPEPMPENALICGVVVEIKRRLVDTALLKARINPNHQVTSTLELAET